MADGSEGLLRWESEVLNAMIGVRYSLVDFQKPRQRDIDTIRAAAEAFIQLAGEVHDQQVKDEEEYQRREYGDE